MSKEARIKESDVKQFWENRASQYGKITYQGITNFADSEESVKRDIIEKNMLKPYLFDKLNILDMGCGVGRISLWLAEKGHNVTGIDYAKSLIDIATVEAKKKDLDVRFICSPSYSYNSSKKFDMITIFAMFLYLNEDRVRQTIMNCKKLLKREGTVIVKESVGVTKRFEVIDKYADALQEKYNAIYRTPSNMIHLFELYGFQLIRAEKLYQHRKETGVWFFEFKFEGAD